VALSYLKLGVEHIALGIDHLLFVLCLMLWVRQPRRMIGAITAFTVAHSLTLALAILGMVNLPAPPVEALIACSIVLLAGRVTARSPPLPHREHPFRMAFAFGLLHGVGFAGSLAEAGVPEQQVGLALFCFNAGVEMGQLMFVAGLLACVWILPGVLRQHSERARRVLAYAAGSAGAFWCVERVVGFWG
jgi:hydrogenase/urease accessory protein HupE